MSGWQSTKEKDLYYGPRNDDNRTKEGKERESCQDLYNRVSHPPCARDRSRDLAEACPTKQTVRHPDIQVQHQKPTILTLPPNKNPSSAP